MFYRWEKGHHHLYQPSSLASYPSWCVCSHCVLLIPITVEQKCSTIRSCLSLTEVDTKLCITYYHFEVVVIWSLLNLLIVIIRYIFRGFYFSNQLKHEKEELLTLFQCMTYCGAKENTNIIWKWLRRVRKCCWLRDSQNSLTTHYGPCPTCKDWMLKTRLPRHQTTCPGTRQQKIYPLWSPAIVHCR